MKHQTAQMPIAGDIFVAPVSKAGRHVLRCAKCGTKRADAWLITGSIETCLKCFLGEGEGKHAR